MTNVLISALLQVAVLSAPGSSYSEAYHASMESGRPLLVLVGAEWCPACVQMKSSIIPALERRGLLAQVHFTYVDFDTQRGTVNKLTNTTFIPQLLLFKKTENGWRRWKLTGRQSVQSLANFLEQNAKVIVAAVPQE